MGRSIGEGLPRVLVVDQDQPSLLRLCSLLQSEGYDATGAETVAAASSMVDRQRIDLVLTTISFPEAERRSWASVLNRLAVPVVAMCDASGAHALDLFDAANEFGAAAVLRRPFMASVLLETVAELLPLLGRRDAARELVRPALGRPLPRQARPRSTPRYWP
jgi:DNA-binding response OmpR family regulator